MSSKAVVWGQPKCPWCDRVKLLLTSSGYEVEYNEIGNGYTKEDFIVAVPRARTVPQVFIEGVRIGGYDDVVEYMNNA